MRLHVYVLRASRRARRHVLRAARRRELRSQQPGPRHHELSRRRDRLWRAGYGKWRRLQLRLASPAPRLALTPRKSKREPRQPRLGLGGKGEAREVEMAEKNGRGSKLPPVPKSARPAVSAKISHLTTEGKPQKQAVATALSMARAGQLGPRGGYKRKGSKP